MIVYIIFLNNFFKIKNHYPNNSAVFNVLLVLSQGCSVVAMGDTLLIRIHDPKYIFINTFSDCNHSQKDPLSDCELGPKQKDELLKEIMKSTPHRIA